MGSILDKITDEELRNELKRREDVKKKQIHDAGVARFKLLIELVKKAPLEALELFAPRHSGTNLCSDGNPHRDYLVGNHPECLRCWFLSEGKYPDPIEVTFYIRGLEER